jgi:hypothetical protein
VSGGRLGEKARRRNGLPGQRQGRRRRPDRGGERWLRTGPVGTKARRQLRTGAVEVSARGEQSASDSGGRSVTALKRDTRVASAVTASRARRQVEQRLRQVGLGVESRDRQVGPRGSDFPISENLENHFFMQEK